MAILISPTNPIRFQDSLDYPFGYNGETQPCYRQKFQLGDNTSIQIRSDDEEVPDLLVYDANTGLLIDEIPFEEIPTLIVNDDQKIYRADLVFADLGEGDLIFKIGDVWSNTVEVRTKHRNTILIDYRNATNDFGIIFDAFESSEMFTIRVEGLIQNFTPKNDDIIYNDQVRNATKLYGLPYNTFTLFIGANSRGVGDYMLDIINRAFCCDMVRVDGVWYEKTESASEWEMYRENDFAFAGMSTEIMPARNKVMERIRVDENLNDNEIMIIQRYSNNFYNHVGNINLANVFKKNCVLDYIALQRKNLPYTLKVGTTVGGSEIGEFDIVDQENVITIRHRFDAPTTLYLSGMDGENDISVVWDRYDKFFNPTGSGGGGETPNVNSGGVIAWHGSMVELEEQFNIVTGLGRDTGDWSGWAIMDGQNGTLDLRGKTIVGLKSDDVDFDEIGNTGGAKDKVIDISEMPLHRHYMFADTTVPAATSSNLTVLSVPAKGTTSTGGLPEKYAMMTGGSVLNPDLQYTGTTQAEGQGAPFSLMNPYGVLVWIKKII